MFTEQDRECTYNITPEARSDILICEINEWYDRDFILIAIPQCSCQWNGRPGTLKEPHSSSPERYSLFLIDFSLLVGKPEGKRSLGRTRRRWIDNIKMDLLEIGLNVVDWIGLAQDRYRWRALVNSVLNLRVPENAGNYRMAAQLVASRVVFSSTELVS
jgi:hypothetical protein